MSEEKLMSKKKPAFPVNEQLDAYLEERSLPNENKYFDPTKVLENRECGLHT